jgi:glycosyltransferase involved in cell wall biosynthesis
LRVIHIITSLRADGAQMMLYKLLAQMPPRRFESLVISLSDGGELAQEIIALGVPVCTLNMKPGTPSPTGLLRLVRAVREFQPDLLQGWMYHGNLAAQLAAFLSRWPPVIWNIRGSHYRLRDEKKLTAAAIWLGGKLSGLPTKIINNSSSSARAHEERFGYRADKRLLIPNGFDTDVFAPSIQARASIRAELALDDNAPLIALVARYHHVKDHAGFLRAAALVAKQCPHTHFVLAGKDVDRTNLNLRSTLHELGIESCVHLVGERRDMPKLLAAMDVVALSSRSEGFPNVIGEAMACAVPCAVTDVGDATWLVGDTGRIASPNNPEALAAAIGELLQMRPTERRELGAKARQRVIEHFSLATIARQYEELYETSVVEEGKGNRIRCAA